MKANESTGELDPDRHRGTDRRTTDDDPDHETPVAEQLTDRQRELVGRDGGGLR